MFCYYEDVTIAVEGLYNEGLQNEGLCPFSRDKYLLYHTCCDKGPQFLRSHTKDRPIFTTHNDNAKHLLYP
jgi:hypothetical protein